LKSVSISLISHFEPAHTSRPFTEATPLSDDLFGADVGEINVREGGGNEVMILDGKDRSLDPLDVYDVRVSWTLSLPIF
jgi:hypothetical protein